MSRKAKFSAAQILDATAAIIAENGPRAATIAAIGGQLKAPSGSIYHRFPSREVLLGRVWLTKAAFFQDRFVAALEVREPVAAGLAAALSLAGSVRLDLPGARIMLLHARTDFLAGDWPADMRDEAVRLRDQIAGAMQDITRRLFGAADAERLRTTSFALLDVPYAAVRRHVAANEMPPPIVDELVSAAYASVIGKPAATLN